MSDRSKTATLALTFHREGDLAIHALRAGVRVVRQARQRGVDCRLLVVLDVPDRETATLVETFVARMPEARLEWVDCGDVGMARNAAVGACVTDWIAFCDGDDYLSAGFISDGLAIAGEAAWVALRPELVVYFGARRACIRQQGSDAPEFSPERMLLSNPWTSAVLAPTGLFREIPYVDLRAMPGFGYEDWHWNCEAVARGVVHYVVPRSAHYVRRKDIGSLNRTHDSIGAVFPPTRLFAPASHD